MFEVPKKVNSDVEETRGDELAADVTVTGIDETEITRRPDVQIVDATAIESPDYAEGDAASLLLAGKITSQEAERMARENKREAA